MKIESILIPVGQFYLFCAVFVPLRPHGDRFTGRTSLALKFKSLIFIDASRFYPVT